MVSTNKSLSVLLLALFIDMLGFGIILPLLPFWVINLGGSGLMFGLLLASYSFFQFVFSPVWGRLSDRIGRRPVIMIGLSGTTISFTLFLLTALALNSIVMIFLSRIIGGIFTSATLPTSQVYISDTTTGKERAKSYGLIGAVAGLGFAFGPAIGGIFNGIGEILTPSLNGYWAPALFATGLSLVNLVAGFLYLSESLPREVRIERAISRARTASPPALNVLRVISSNPAVLVIVIIFAIMNLVYASFNATAVLFGKDRFGLDETLNGMVFMEFGLLLIIIQGSLIGTLSKRFTETLLVAAGLLVAAVSFLGYSTVDSFIALLLWNVPYALGFSIAAPTLRSLLSKKTPQENLGEVMGLNEGISALMRIFGPIVGTLIYSVDMMMVWFAGASLYAMALLLALSLRHLVKNKIPIQTTEKATTLTA